MVVDPQQRPDSQQGPAHQEGPAPQPNEVLCCTATEVRRGDQVAFVSAEDEHIAGEVTGKRVSRDQSRVTLVVNNRVHFVSSDQQAIVIRAQSGPDAPVALTIDDDPEQRPVRHPAPTEVWIG